MQIFITSWCHITGEVVLLIVRSLFLKMSLFYKTVWYHTCFLCYIIIIFNFSHSHIYATQPRNIHYFSWCDIFLENLDMSFSIPIIQVSECLLSCFWHFIFSFLFPLGVFHEMIFSISTFFYNHVTQFEIGVYNALFDRTSISEFQCA